MDNHNGCRSTRGEAHLRLDMLLIRPLSCSFWLLCFIVGLLLLFSIRRCIARLHCCILLSCFVILFSIALRTGLVLQLGLIPHLPLAQLGSQQSAHYLSHHWHSIMAEKGTSTTQAQRHGAQRPAWHATKASMHVKCASTVTMTAVVRSSGATLDSSDEMSCVHGNLFDNLTCCAKTQLLPAYIIGSQV